MRLIGILIAIILLALVVWAAVAGPVTVLRILRYGDTDINDYSHYPGRRLKASSSPDPFDEAEVEFQLPASVLDDYGHQGDLDAILEANDSIAFLIIQGDMLLAERYYQGHTRTSLSQAFSMSKSFTSALIGMAIDDGVLQGVDQPIVEFLPELAEQGFGEVKVRHLLTMMSGTDYIENDNPFQEHVILNFTPGLEEEILDFKMEDEPGVVFRYKSGDNALLALLLDRALGAETLTEYTQRRLWTPMGMEFDGVWTIDHDGDGLEKTWCCLAATARDFAKLGRLYLHQGTWNGQELVSSSWVVDSTQEGAVPESRWPGDFASIGIRNYGYQWWLLSEQDGDYLALGKDGQYLYVNPAQQVAILRLGWSMGELPTSKWISLFQTIAREIP